MNITDYLLGVLSLYGLPVLFVALVIGCIGVPLPASLMLVAAGSFVEQGDLNQWSVLLLGSAGAVLGDNVGYGIGRWGGRPLTNKISRFINRENKIAEAEKWTAKWGGVGVFLSRWLLTPLGPWINLTSGITHYPWYRFFILDVIGEALWVILYVTLGRIFSDRVQEMTSFLTDLAWGLVGLVVAIFLGARLLRYLHWRPDKFDQGREAESRLATAPKA